jgi:hypothetical protein
MSDTQGWDDLRDRLQRAAASLDLLSLDSDDWSHKERLDAKASGVRLALSYLEEHKPGRLTSYKAESFKCDGYPCPNCGQSDTVLGYYFASEDGKHQHTRYVCTFWRSGLDAGGYMQHNPCGWSGWTAGGPNKPLDMTPQRPVR